jgi:CheY-like chemotaxis protein
MSGHVSALGADRTTEPCKLIQESAPIRTLVVDDTPDVLNVVCAFLDMEDRVELIGRATDGSEALEAVRSLRPDLVVMDVQMPIMDGLTAAALIRLQFPEVSIVLMSACPSHFIENQIRASGADAFIDKLEFGEMFPRVLSRLRTAGQTRV